MILVPYTNLY